MPAATGSPSKAFAEAVYRTLNGDSTLAGLLTGGVVAALPQTETATRSTARTVRPYVLVGRRELMDNGMAGAMQREGGECAVTVDVFSNFVGPEEAQSIQAQIRTVLTRIDVGVTGFTLYGGSVHCTEELVFSDFDADMPERSGYHGVQRWVGLLEESGS